MIKVAKMAEVLENKSKLVIVDDMDIALFLVNGEYFATHNVYPHQHFSLFHQGSREGMKITCPMHGWTFDLETGRAYFGSGRLKTYRLKVIGEDLWMEHPKSE